MTTAREKLIDSTVPLCYHLVSRCVRRSWLCGRDPYSGRRYDHRKKWLKARLYHLAKYFAVEIDAFAIMSNHFHLIVYYDPLASEQWSDDEVVYRWVEAFPPRATGAGFDDLEAQKSFMRDMLKTQPDQLRSMRKRLGSLSAFMKHLKQPIARRANQEDRCTGHFFEGRFYSGALLNEAAVLAAMAYVDLNPVRAKIARTIEACQDSSISVRLKNLNNSSERLKEALSPLISGIERSSKRLHITLAEYAEQLCILVGTSGITQLTDAQSLWFAQVASIRKKQRAFGFLDDLEAWASRRGWKRMGSVLPD